MLPGAALAQMSFAISDYAPDAPVAGNVEIGAFSFADERMQFPLTVAMPNLWAEIDKAARARGNLTGKEIEFHWIGPTRLKDASNDALTLTSRGRLRTTVTATLLGQTISQTLQDSRNFDVRLAPVWDSETKELRLTAELIDIHEIPVWAKDIVRQIGVPLATQVPLFSASSEELAALDLELSDIELTGHEAGAVMSSNVSLSAQAGRMAVMRLLYRR
ncbi:MAG: hypothetical protein AAF891_02190 [Pseudomonadota bacterium]